jgi:hypothetical protein
MEQSRKILTGENLSANEKKAKIKVPAIKPSCTALVIQPTDSAARSRDVCRSEITAFPANQSDVPANCETTIAGRIRRGIN